MTTGSLAHPAPASHGGVVNIWQRGVPVTDVRIVTPSFLMLLGLVLIGTVIGCLRLFGGNLAWTGMTDAYAWGVWKTFNVMGLTALGSGALGVGVAAWVFNRRNLHSVMRTAVVTSLLFYSTGLLGLLTDIGRPWNFWNMLLPWRWNTESALWEISLAMPVYVSIFLAYEAGPIVVERLWYRGGPRMRAFLDRWHPRIRKLYPWVVAGAYVTPMMHQSGLGALMVLAGQKVHPLWQTDTLPILYLLQAFVCGYACVLVVLMSSCLVWRRPLDSKVIAELSAILCGLALVWTAARWVDLDARGQLGAALSLDRWSLVFLFENLLTALPAIVLLFEASRATPRTVFRCAVLIGIGGVLYRYVPTAIAYDPGPTYVYFPSFPELLVTVGLIALIVLVWSVAVKVFAILPAPVESWNRLFEPRPSRRNAHGHARHD